MMPQILMYDGLAVECAKVDKGRERLGAERTGKAILAAPVCQPRPVLQAQRSPVRFSQLFPGSLRLCIELFRLPFVVQAIVCAGGHKQGARTHEMEVEDRRQHLVTQVEGEQPPFTQIGEVGQAHLGGPGLYDVAGSGERLERRVEVCLRCVEAAEVAQQLANLKLQAQPCADRRRRCGCIPAPASR